MDEAAARARRTYDAAADRYDALGFWAHWGARTVRRLALAPGAEVLDAPCGSGASALPAARVAGSVLGVDVSENQVALARAKAVAEGLGNATFRVGDMRGYRATIDALSPEERAHVERRVRDAMADGPPMRAPAVLAVARR